MRTARAMAVGLLLAGAGCSSELGRVTLSGPGRAECAITLEQPGTITFHTELEVEGPKELAGAYGDYRYDIEAQQEGKTIASTQCEPLDVGFSLVSSRSSSRTRIGAYRHSLKGARVVGCSLELPTQGQSTLQVELVQDRVSQADFINVVLIARR